MSDYFGLKKVDKELGKLSFKMFKEPKETKQGKFFKPKAKYTKQERPDYSREIKELKSVAKNTGKGFEKLVDSIKNRKIHRLEKQALKAKAKADQLAHEIKTKQALIDSLTDIARYEKENKKTDQELEKIKTDASNE